MILSTGEENHSDQNFSQRLAQERKRLGLTQRDAAERCGVRREMWGRYERGDAQPTVSVLEHFCALGASPDMLLKGALPESSPVAVLDEIAAQLGLSNHWQALEPIGERLEQERKEELLEMYGQARRAHSGGVRGSDMVRAWLATSPNVLFASDWQLMQDVLEALEFSLSVSNKSMWPDEKASAVRELWIKAKQSARGRVELRDVQALIESLPLPSNAQ